MELAVDHRTPRRSAPPARRAALDELLTELGDRVKPVALARERTMPVAEPFRVLLPEDGLVRGRVMSCHGAAAMSLASGLVRDALVAGAWMAVVDVASFGADAAAEVGVPLERVVRVESGVDTASAAAWVDVMAAAVDGFDVVLTSVPAALRGDRRPAMVRTLAKRVQQQGAVVVVVGEAGALGVDVELHTESNVWTGLGDGAGRLRRRRIDVASSGRRLPGGRSGAIVWEGAGPGVELTPAATIVDDRDPQAELLAEMIDVVDLNDRELPADAGVAPLAG
ncbi:MAG: hypothetical protein AB8G26_19390 [Ilumatobacter sp.]